MGTGVEIAALTYFLQDEYNSSGDETVTDTTSDTVEEQDTSVVNARDKERRRKIAGSNATMLTGMSGDTGMKAGGTKTLLGA